MNPKPGEIYLVDLDMTTGAARVLLRVAAKHPNTVLEAMRCN